MTATIINLFIILQPLINLRLKAIDVAGVVGDAFVGDAGAVADKNPGARGRGVGAAQLVVPLRHCRRKPKPLKVQNRFSV